MAELNIAVSSDLRFLPGAIGTLASIRLSLEEDIPLNVVYLHDGFDLDTQSILLSSLSKFKGKTHIDFKKIELDCSSFPKFYTPSTMTYARFCLPELCSFSKVIYIDTDFLVCRSLYPLMLCKTSNLGIAAVQDWLLTAISKDLHHDPPFYVDAYKPYFNAGLLVLDLDRIRSNQIFQKAKELLSNYPKYCSSHDQSALNYILNGEFEPIGDIYNKQNNRSNLPPSETIKILSDRSANIHFISQNKPWLVYSHYPAEIMFRMLLDYIYPTWKTDRYTATETKMRSLLFYAPLFPAFFKFKGLIKKIIGKNSIREIKASKDWQTILDDAKLFRLKAPELSTLYSGWKNQIESGMKTS